MSTFNAQEQTLSAWRTEIRESLCPADANSEGGSGESSSGAGNLSGRSFGEDRPAKSTLKLFGGILAQLIQDAEVQLGKAQECVEWYQREVAELQTRLENLKRLQQTEE
jgi:hypothetical protein